MYRMLPYSKRQGRAFQTKIITTETHKCEMVWHTEGKASNSLRGVKRKGKDSLRQLVGDEAKKVKYILDYSTCALQ